MSEPKSQNNNTQVDNEINLKRVQLLEKIINLKEQFITKLNTIKTNFENMYDEQTTKLLKQFREVDIKLNKINPGEELNNLKKNINAKLENTLTTITNNFAKCFESLENSSKEIYNTISEEMLKDIDENANQIIEQKEKLEKEKIDKEKLEKEKLDKEKFEKEKKEKEEEAKNKEQAATPVIKIKKEREKLKPIVIEGKNDKSNAKLLEKLEEYNQIILKDMSRDNIEYLFTSKKKENLTLKGENPLANIIIKNCDLEQLNLDKLYPDLFELKIKNTKMSFYISNSINLNNIESLKLENVGLIDNNFNDLFDKMRNNENIRNNLNVFSVKNNKITFIDYKRGYADNILSTMIFKNLEILDMSFNKLYIFQNPMFNCLENIKFINLTDNNISFPQSLFGLIKSAKIKKCLLLLTRNLSILKEQENKDYVNYLKEILPKINYPIKKIVFDNIFCGQLYPIIKELNFSSFKDSLEYLDLSNSQLHDKDLISLFDTQWHFSNLKKLILVANYLTQEFIYTISSDNKYYMEKLKVLKLSENEIKCSDLDKFKKFLEFFKNLNILELNCTPFEKDVNNFFKKKIIMHHDPENKKGFTKPFDEEDKKVIQILDGHYLKEKTNLMIYILDLNGGKYSDKINQFYPDLLERLHVVNKFPYKT